FYYLETKRFDIQPADASYKLTGTVTSGLSSATGTDSSNSGGGWVKELDHQKLDDVLNNRAPDGKTHEISS
ncbi:hypothetical protein ONJ23_26640, partial [Salmonella enterica subsp. enterica serovar Virginia]|nr:hypothetical protein [Salmonella enterica subsp. enterica serovar Virginia]